MPLQILAAHVAFSATVMVFNPGEQEVEELAFADALRGQAPNSNLMWLRGQYVEADRANENGALWTADELAIKSLSPRLMPVTVMHDPRTAVGLIADTKLLTREADNVPRSRIDTTLGVWAHRFPEVAEEAAANYAQGTLMQSMECLPAYYDCIECGRQWAKLPGGTEKASWCEHLTSAAAENRTPVRRLRDVTFTGTGLIFGTRGARGAFTDAHLDVWQEEVAEFHERAHRDSRTRPRSKRSMATIEIERSEYDDLKAKAARVPELEGKLSKAEEDASRVPELERTIETTEAEKVSVTKERDDERAKVQAFEETARTAQLSKDRLGVLGTAFLGKLGEFTRKRLDEQAGKFSDEEWDARLQELEEVASVKRDEGGANDGGASNGSGASGEFSREEVARSGAGTGGGNGGSGAEPAAPQRQSVVRGLFAPAKS
jgi:hypothetical protein